MTEESCSWMTSKNILQRRKQFVVMSIQKLLGKSGETMPVKEAISGIGVQDRQVPDKATVAHCITQRQFNS